MERRGMAFGIERKCKKLEKEGYKIFDSIGNKGGINLWKIKK